MKDENGKVTFDQDEQAEVDRIIQERLGREKEKYTDYEDLKGVTDELKAYGYTGTVKDIREAVKTQREEAQRQQELQELQKQAKEDGTSPELLKEIKELKNEITDLKKDKTEKEKAIQVAAKVKEDFENKVKEFQDTYPDVDLDKLNEDEDFIEFLRDSNPNLSLVKVYERYNKYTHGAVEKATAKIQSNLERSTASGRQKNSNSNYGLTAEQRQTVDDWNKRNPQMKMTYEEFSNNLRR